MDKITKLFSVVIVILSIAVISCKNTTEEVRIIVILNKFDALLNNIFSRLSVEINEHYRKRILIFQTLTQGQSGEHV